MSRVFFRDSFIFKAYARRLNMAAVCEGVIISVGKSWEPIVYTLKEFRPKFAAFLCTPDSRETLDKVLFEYPIPPSCNQILQTPDDPQAIGQMVKQFYSAYKWLREEKKLDALDIIVDPTPGRKWMSSAVTMIASYLGVNMAYVDVVFKDGKPDSSTMKIEQLGNAYDQTGFLEIERGIQFFNAGAWEHAQETFRRIQSHHSSLNDLAVGLAKLSGLMKRWDLFTHYKINLSQDFDKVYHTLKRISFSDPSYAEMVNSLSKDITRMQAVSSRINSEPRPNLLLVVDLFLNAQRCLDKGRFDDGVARLYRVLESLAQYYLHKDYSISTSKPNFDKMDSQIVERFRDYKGGQLPQKLGLEDDYTILFLANHSLLGKAVITGFGKDHRPKNIFNQLLEKRNNSIMAHGFEPIEKNSAVDLFKKTEGLLKRVLGEEFIKLSEELSFPRLPSFFAK